MNLTTPNHTPSFMPQNAVGEARVDIKKLRFVRYSCRYCGKTKAGIPEFKIYCGHDKTNAKGEVIKRFLVECDPTGFVLDNLGDETLGDSVPKEIIDYVSDSNYCDRLISEVDKFIVGERSMKKAIINNVLGGRLVINAEPTSYHLLFSALSGAGKDHLVRETLKLLPEGIKVKKTRLSPKALNYMHDSKTEPYFTWNGKVLYCEDVRPEFLNSDTLKVMMSGGSDITIVDKGRAVEIHIEGIPVILLTSATAEPNDELVRRVSIGKLDQTEDQTYNIMKLKTEIASFKVNVPKPTYATYTTYVLKRINVIIPFADKLLDAFPKILIARTAYSRLLDMIKASCALHQYTREEDSEGNYIANLQDLKNGVEVFLSLYGDNIAPITSAQKSVLEYLKARNVGLSATELFDDVGNINGYTQIGTMIEGLRSLHKKGLVEVYLEPQEKGRSIKMYKYLPTLDKDSLSKLTNLTNISDISNLSNSFDYQEVEDEN